MSPTKKEETEDKANYILQHIRNKMIKITDKAKKELSKALNEYPGKMLRIIFAGFGWSGPELGLTLDEPKKEEINTISDIDILIDEQTKLNMQPSTIDCNMSDSGEYQFFIRNQDDGCWG